ncbi:MULTISPECIES: hypothetical protein [unclassified Streptomyces]|uniref:hypothetical protein n=1 Tax=unclassified Streptomyces TaxID=2593676 RepID=UPI002257B52D|nr:MULTISPECIES: hypothetical protein [unclassified Streptomyces]MCX4869358.1 hypothetical protein [Streptomyces sp. NBC_00906]
MVLQRLAKSPYPFVWQALATNPHTPPEALQELSAARDSVWNDNKLFRLLADHPSANRVVLRAFLEAVAAKLDEGERPYAAALALADRLELEVDEVRKLGTLRGASARLRHLLNLRLSVRI